MLSRHTQMMHASGSATRMTIGVTSGSVVDLRHRNKPQQTEQSIYGFLRDAYYNFKFKTRSDVTTPKQLAMTFEPSISSNSKSALTSKEASDFIFTNDDFDEVDGHDEEEKEQQRNGRIVVAFFLNKAYSHNLH